MITTGVVDSLHDLEVVLVIFFSFHPGRILGDHPRVMAIAQCYNILREVTVLERGKASALYTIAKCRTMERLSGVRWRPDDDRCYITWLCLVCRGGAYRHYSRTRHGRRWYRNHDNAPQVRHR